MKGRFLKLFVNEEDPNISWHVSFIDRRSRYLTLLLFQIYYIDNDIGSINRVINILKVVVDYKNKCDDGKHFITVYPCCPWDGGAIYANYDPDLKGLSASLNQIEKSDSLNFDKASNLTLDITGGHFLRNSDSIRANTVKRYYKEVYGEKYGRDT